MPDALTILAFMLDHPGGTRRRRVMVRPIIPRGAPFTIVLPDSVEQSEKSITLYISQATQTPVKWITWQSPLRHSQPEAPNAA